MCTWFKNQVRQKGLWWRTNTFYPTLLYTQRQQLRFGQPLRLSEDKLGCFTPAPLPPRLLCQPLPVTFASNRLVHTFFLVLQLYTVSFSYLLPKIRILTSYSSSSLSTLKYGLLYISFTLWKLVSFFYSVIIKSFMFHISRLEKLNTNQHLLC